MRTPITPAERKKFTLARYKEDIKDWKKSGFVKGVEIKIGNSPCDYAIKLAGFYLINDSPRIPHAKCNAEYGCTCWWIQIFDDE